MNGEADLLAEVDQLHARLAQLEARLRSSYRSGRKPGTTLEVLFVEIGALAAAFELDCIHEVVPAAALSPLPEAPSWVLGTLNLRGASLPVVHIGARLGKSAPELRVEDLIVVAATDLGKAGFIVSGVGAVLSVKLDDQASLTEAPHASYVVGTFTQKGEARLLLGIRELLRHSDLSPFLGAREAAP